MHKSVTVHPVFHRWASDHQGQPIVDAVIATIEDGEASSELIRQIQILYP